MKTLSCCEKCHDAFFEEYGHKCDLTHLPNFKFIDKRLKMRSIPRWALRHLYKIDLKQYRAAQSKLTQNKDNLRYEPKILLTDEDFTMLLSDQIIKKGMT